VWHQPRVVVCHALTVNAARWWINGVIVEGRDAAVPVNDHGLTVGDGCFETTTVVRGEAFAMRRHLARLRQSLSGLGITLELSDDELRQATADTIAANEAAGVVRLTVTAGPGPLGSGRGDGEPTVIVGVGPTRPWPPTAAVVTVPWPRNERGALAGVKSTSYAENVIALAYAHERDANEAIFANTLGALCEGTGTNVFVNVDGRLVTPPLRSGCLAGVTRALVLETSEVEQADVSIEVFEQADEAFLTSSTRNVMPIARINDRVLQPGPLSEAASQRLAALMAETTDP
jgi:branched-subunit amino acid aminotransferase/4-amino-4-deoxychorismate lyase